MITIKKAGISKLGTRVNKDGDVIAKVVVEYNLTRSGELSLIGDLAAIQEGRVTVNIDPEQMSLQEAGKP